MYLQNNFEGSIARRNENKFSAVFLHFYLTHLFCSYSYTNCADSIKLHKNTYFSTYH
jgi:hypothetical protein